MRIVTKGWMYGMAATAALTAGFAGSSLLQTRPAEAACCYFAAQEKDINQPGQKAFIQWDPVQKIASWTVQPKFEGNAVDFGMVIPSPGQPKLDEMPRDFFKDLAIYSILMPLPQGIWEGGGERMVRKGGVAFGGAPGSDRRESKDKGVTVLESGVVGSLDYKVIKAEDSSGLFDWLKENSYVYSGDKETLKFYIDKKWFFTVMKIDPKQMKKAADGSYVGEVTPTRFTFASDKCVYPLRITALSVKDKTDALFYVQAPEQMDLPGDLSWMHSYRVMWLTYMLGCSANESQQKELQARQAWVQEKMAKDPRYETTKLEWSKKLGAAEISVLDDPATHYAQMGLGTLPEGFKVTSLADFTQAALASHIKNGGKEDEHWKAQAKRISETYAATKGVIVKVADPDKSFSGCDYEWWANREVPAEDVKGLARLKGHLQSGQWLTKFRKVLRKDEMTDDLLLEAVPAGMEQEYVRIMPTSPP